MNNNSINNLLAELFPNNRGRFPTNQELLNVVNNEAVNLDAFNFNSNSNSNRNRVHANRRLNNNSNTNGRIVAMDRTMKISRKNFAKPRRLGTLDNRPQRGRYRTKTSCHRLPISAVRDLATKRNIQVDARRVGRKGPHSSSRPSLCRRMYGFDKLFEVARHVGVTKTRKMPSGARKYKSVDEIQREVEKKLQTANVPKKYSYKEILNRGLAKGRFASRGR